MKKVKWGDAEQILSSLKSMEGRLASKTNWTRKTAQVYLAILEKAKKRDEEERRRQEGTPSS